SNASLADDRGQGTITDNDTPPTLSIGDATVQEGASGTSPAVFTLTLSQPSGQAVIVSYTTAADTASSGSDFAATNGVLTIAAGQSGALLTVQVRGDQVDEPDESFQVDLSDAAGATLLDAQGVGTILDDDLPPTMSIGDATVTEGNSGTTNALLT